MNEIKKLAARNRQRAYEIIRQTGIVQAWESIGAEVHLVGSLRMGLLVKHRDIDFHVYTDELVPAESFRAMARLAEQPGIRKMMYGNLSATEEACLEWHVWYEDQSGEEWTIDLIQIRRGSRYDGYFERMADRIEAAMTPEMRDAIMRLKYETPHTEKIMGVEYYRAVISGGVRSYAELQAWRAAHPAEGVVEWIP